jgi:arylsulfatase A-like enzyme
MKNPNVWFIMVDQLRWDAMGCYGNQVIETTNLDFLASQGTCFNNAYTCTPTCIPARASLITGKDAWNVGVMYRDPAQGPALSVQNTLPQKLAEAGYHTQCVGCLGVGPRRSLQGFHDVRLYSLTPDTDTDYNKWFRENRPGDCGSTDHGLGPNSWMCRPWHLPEYLHPTAWIAQESIRFIERRDPSRPFFLKTSFLRPHAPYDPPQYYLDLYNHRELPPSVAGDWAGIHDLPTADPDAWRGRLRPDQERLAKAGYYASIHFIDHQIGCVRQYLKRHGLLDNTMIVFTSDHGDMMGDHHLWRKSYTYEGSAHIPFFVSLPPAMQADVQAQVDAPVCLQDIMPTILDGCGVESPADLDGESVLPLMQRQKPAWRAYVHGEHRACYTPENEHHYLTDGKWTYIWFTQTNQEQLFHLESDRYETRNLASAQATELRMWRKRLVETLAPRNAGLVHEGQLVCQAGKPAPISPHYRGLFPN